MVNTQLLHVQNVHTKYRKFFLQVFEFALAEFCAKVAKINAPRILPRLQYVPMKSLNAKTDISI